MIRGRKVTTVVECDMCYQQVDVQHFDKASEEEILEECAKQHHWSYHTSIGSFWNIYCRKCAAKREK